MEEDEVPSLIEVINSDGNSSTVAGEHGDDNKRKVPITIVSEFGDSADIEKALTVNEKGEEVQEWLELGNGCICCSVKDQGVNAIESLMERRGAFDYILLETSGVADPGNIAPLFWVDEGLGSTIYLDGIVVLADAKNIIRSLEEQRPHFENADDEAEGREEYHKLTTAHLQLSHADVIVLNKIDTLSADELKATKARIQGVNAMAKIIETEYGRVPELEGALLDLHAYDSADAVPSIETHGHPDPSISTVTFELPAISMKQLDSVDEWLRSVLWESHLPGQSEQHGTSNTDWSIHRLKGRLVLDDGQVRMVQGVREVFEITELKTVSRIATESQVGKLVVIGRNVKDVGWKRSLESLLNKATV